ASGVVAGAESDAAAVEAVRARDARPRAHLREGAVAVVGEEVVARALESSGAAHHRLPAVFAVAGPRTVRGTHPGPGLGSLVLLAGLPARKGGGGGRGQPIEAERGVASDR